MNHKMPMSRQQGHLILNVVPTNKSWSIALTRQNQGSIKKPFSKASKGTKNLLGGVSAAGHNFSMP